MTAKHKPARAGEGRSTALIPATRVAPIAHSVCQASVAFPGAAMGQFNTGLDSNGINAGAPTTCAGSGRAVGANNICIGDFAGQSLSGDYNQVSGFFAGQSLSGSRNLVSGRYADQSLSGSDNQMSGLLAGQSLVIIAGG